MRLPNIKYPLTADVTKGFVMAANGVCVAHVIADAVGNKQQRNRTTRLFAAAPEYCQAVKLLLDGIDFADSTSDTLHALDEAVPLLRAAANKAKQNLTLTEVCLFEEQRHKTVQELLSALSQVLEVVDARARGAELSDALQRLQSARDVVTRVCEKL